MKKLISITFCALALLSTLPLNAQRNSIPDGFIIDDIFDESGNLIDIECERLGGGCLAPIKVRADR